MHERHNLHSDATGRSVEGPTIARIPKQFLSSSFSLMMKGSVLERRRTKADMMSTAGSVTKEADVKEKDQLMKR